jgi:hypothetical protein
MIYKEHWRRLLRLFVFVFELYTILVLLSSTFLVPGPDDIWRFSMVIGAAVISLAVACWAQSLRLQARVEPITISSIALSLPVVLWMSVAVLCIPAAVYGFWMHWTHQWP